MKKPHTRIIRRGLQLLKRRKALVFGGTIGLISVGMLSFFVLKTSLPVTVNYTGNDVKVDQPITISLSQYLRIIDTSRITMTPAVAGTWHLERKGIVSKDMLVFTPKTYFREDTKYTVTLPQAQRVFGAETPLPPVSFVTEKAPSLAVTDMATWTDNQTIAADAVFSASLVSANRHLRTLELRTSPSIATTPTVQHDKDYTWTPTALLPHGTTVTLELFDTKNQQSLLKKSVRIAAEPSLTSPLHRRNVDERDNIVLTFAQGIDHSAATITFDVPGKGMWQNDTTYAFSPDKLAPNTTYHYTIEKNLRSKEGGILQADIVDDFATIGPIAVVATSPRGNDLAQASQVISFTFNRPVDRASAEQRLSISSGTITNKSWSGNTLSATVTNLGFQQTVTASIAAGVANATFGVPSTRPYSLSFTTEVRSAKLAIPFFRQQYAGSCTAAALRMILAYRGTSADDMSIVQQMGYNPRPRDNSTDPATWDDPQQMFVGDINGSIIAGTGAGPDAPPVAKAARAYGRSASAVTGIGSGWIAQQVYAGNPVIMFGAFRATGMTSWQTPSGRTATMNLTGHATTVIGVKGEPSAPLGFWVHDPMNGAAYWSVAAVEANIARDPYRQAVVVY